VTISWEFTPPYLSSGISNLLQPAQTEVVLGQLSTYVDSWEIHFAKQLVQTSPASLYMYTRVLEKRGVGICLRSDTSFSWGTYTDLTLTVVADLADPGL
jgi:hypothetical protein